MVNPENLKDALIDVRKAHRLIASYQKIMLSIVFFIKKKLGFPDFVGEKRFSNPLSGRSGLNLWPTMWSWDFIYSYQFEYRLGSKDLPDSSRVFLSVVQYSDTGFYDSDSDTPGDSQTFNPAEESSSKLLFLMEHAVPGKQLLMTARSCTDVYDIIHSKKYGRSNHVSDRIPAQESDDSEFLLYSIPIERFFDESSTIDALQDYLKFLEENGIVLHLY